MLYIFDFVENILFFHSPTSDAMSKYVRTITTMLLQFWSGDRIARMLDARKKYEKQISTISTIRMTIIRISMF